MKKKVAVIFGGKSTEHEISRLSASFVLSHIDINKYDVYVIGITKTGQWIEYSGDVSKIENGQWEEDEFYKNPKGEEILFNKQVDVVFPVLHGLYGEDGTIQGLCKLIGVPCVGSGVLSSALCMDKVYSRYILERFNIRQPEYIVVKWEEYEKNKNDIVRKIENTLKYPLFVKPANTGSSIGITKVHNKNEVIDGIEIAFKYDRRIIIERAINAREIEVSVIGNEFTEVSVPGEIIPSKEFYDYEDKYKIGNSKLIIPANLNNNQREEIESISIKAYKALDCAGMARVDFLIDKETEDIYINEINTIPGFTGISMFPKLWKETGKTYELMIDKIIELAIIRNNN